MLNIDSIRKLVPKTLVIGSHSLITQAMLDFDYLAGKNSPSVKAIIKNGKRSERFFFGEGEILLPYFPTLNGSAQDFIKEINFFLNVVSAHRVLSSTTALAHDVPNLLGGVIFAENTPEIHSLELYKKSQEQDIFIIGPSSVGFLVPGKLKLGAIGGVEIKQLSNPVLYEKGNIASFSASGGMTNELLNILRSLDKRVSFSLSFGGDRFPITTPKQALLAAENDPDTTHIVYFGELGGVDEYEIADMIKEGLVTKPIVAYVAGSIADLFPTSPQFGHAKAMAKNQKESAKEKTKALKEVGVEAANTFTEFVRLIEKIPSINNNTMIFENTENLIKRQKSTFASSIAEETDSSVNLFGYDQLELAQNNSFAFIATSLLLGKMIKSKELEEFVDLTLKLLVDNGPSVSGAVNTMITARAGKDMVSSLCAGLLTIGKRFGGAVNTAAQNWIEGVEANTSPEEFVEKFAKESEIIEGIGHKKYRVDTPDPRVTELMKWAEKLESKKYLNFAKAVEKVTTGKKANLILNVDGTMAAILLDILTEKEDYTVTQLQELTKAETFNAFFVIPRTVGFIAHYLDQKRLDEPLFRLPKEDVAFVKDLKQPLQV
jgi:ATP citrate (pro-S)-lyase